MPPDYLNMQISHKKHYFATKLNVSSPIILLFQNRFLNPLNCTLNFGRCILEYDSDAHIIIF